MFPAGTGRRMPVDDINLYIEVSTRQVQKCRRRYMYVLEYVQENKTETATGLGENVSLERTVLTAVERGISRITRPGGIRIYMGCQYALVHLENGNYQKWEQNGFRNAKGGEVRNSDLWIRVKKLLDRHSWHGEGDAWHPYQEYILFQLGKWEEKEKKEGGTAG